MERMYDAQNGKLADKCSSKRSVQFTQRSFHGLLLGPGGDKKSVIDLRPPRNIT